RARARETGERAGRRPRRCPGHTRSRLQFGHRPDQSRQAATIPPASVAGSGRVPAVRPGGVTGPVLVLGPSPRASAEPADHMQRRTLCARPTPSGSAAAGPAYAARDAPARTELVVPPPARRAATAEPIRAP